MTTPVPDRQVVQILKAEGQPDGVEAQKLQAVDHSCKVFGHGMLPPQTIQHCGAIVEPKPVDALHRAS